MGPEMQTIHARFTYPSSDGQKRMPKMSIDLLSPRPIHGQHDPLDGYITYRQVRRQPERH
jgi:hypothetical protein